MRVKTKVGDVFMIPLPDGKAGLGTVAAKWRQELYLAVFEGLFEKDTLPNDVRSLKPLLASSSLDAKIWHGHWPLIDGASDPSRIVQPIYKVEEPSGWMAESFDRKLRFKIDDVTAAQLRYRKCVAPVRLERAFKAHAGALEWRPDYDELRYSEVLRVRESIAM